MFGSALSPKNQLHTEASHAACQRCAYFSLAPTVTSNTPQTNMLATRALPLSPCVCIAALLLTAGYAPTTTQPTGAAGDTRKHFGTNTYSAYIARATISIIHNVYVPVSSSLDVTRATDLSAGTNTVYHQSGFINDVLRSTSADIAQTVEMVTSIGPNRLRTFNVLFVDGYAAFRRIYERMSESCFDYTGLYTVVLTESSRYQYETITSILQDCWALHIINVVVLVSIHPQARTAVYTYFPFTRFHCEAVAPVILNYYVAEGFLYDSVPFFPKKVGGVGWGERSVGSRTPMAGMKWL